MKMHLKAFTKQQRDEEKHKISIKDNELQRFIRRLENHPFFVGQIKFMFDFCGTEPGIRLRGIKL